RRRGGDQHRAERRDPGRKEVQRPGDLKRRPDEDRREVHEGRPDETGVCDVGRFALGRNGAVSPRHGARQGSTGRTGRYGIRRKRAVAPASRSAGGTVRALGALREGDFAAATAWVRSLKDLLAVPFFPWVAVYENACSVA